MQRLMKLRTAIAFERSQNVAGQTLAVQTDDGNALIALAYYERDMFLRLLRAAECNDFRRLAGRHRKPRSRRYGETRGIVIGLYVDSIDLHFRLDITSEGHTSEPQSIMRSPYAYFRLQKKK